MSQNRGTAVLSVDRSAIRPDVAIAIEPDFDFLSPAYRAHHRASAATAFQAPLWLHRIHRDLAPRLGARQHTLVIRSRDDGALVAVIPLVVQRSRGLSILQPADFGVCDYNALVADRHMLALLAEQPTILDRIDELTRTEDLLLFRKVREDGFPVARLFRRARVSPCENAAYHSEVGEDFDLWRRRTLSRNFTKELGRLGRQLEAGHGRYETRPATGEQEIREAFAFLGSVRAGRFGDDLINNAVYFDFYRDYAIAAAESGEAITYVSYLAGKPVAVLFGLNGDDDFHAVQIGLDSENLGKFSLGNQIIFQTIKRRFYEGFRRFDMGLGNTGYKTHFRVEETKLSNLTAASSVAGAAIELIYVRSKPLKDLLKRLTPVR